jgi:cytochrome c oxidase assembly factor CtaG
MRPLYASYADQSERLLGLSPLQDQRLAGIVMMAEQLLTLGTFVAVLLVAQHRKLFRPTEGERRVAA